MPKPRVARDLRSLTKLLYSITITQEQLNEILRKAQALIKMATLAREAGEELEAVKALDDSEPTS